jgi:hypothetical protein
MGTGGYSSTLGTGGAPCGANTVGETVNPDTGGCTPGAMPGLPGSMNTTTGQRLFCIGNKEYLLQVNEWGSTAPQTMDFGGGSYYFKMTQQTGTGNTSGAPTGFPSMFIGANQSGSTLGSGLPKLVSSLASVPTTWDWTDNGATEAADANNIYNATYDVWFSTNPAGEPTKSCPTGGFLMVWLHKPTRAQPIGSIRYPAVTITGIPGTWDVWIGPNNCSSPPVPCISYVRTGSETNPVYSMSFDLNLFIQDAVNNRPSTLANTMYLTNVFTGFEIWSGGVGLQTTDFCAGVN